MFIKEFIINNQQFDSKAEQIAFETVFEPSGCIRCSEKFPSSFTDSSGASFNAYPDFYNPKSDLWIEFKDGKLNNMPTKAKAEESLDRQEAYRGSLSSFDKLKFGWNHSRHKQAAVQKVLTPDNFIIVFKEFPNFTYYKKYDDLDIKFISLEHVQGYLLACQLFKNGDAVSYILPHYTR